MRQGFYFNEAACIGCRTCQVACLEAHDVPADVRFRRVWTYAVGVYPQAKVFHLSLGCNHCANPACVAACPVSAMVVDEVDGTIQHDDEACIGCQACVEACPYGVPQFRADLNIVQKCDGCKNLRDEGDELPVCVAACPMRALEFGDIDELRTKHGNAVSQIATLPEPTLTNPSMIMDAKQCAFEEGAVELVI